MHEMEAYQDFGKGKAQVEKLLLFFRMKFDPQLTFLDDTYTDTNATYAEALKTMDKIEDARDAIVKVEMPSSLSNPNHWGHIAWKYVLFSRKNGSE